MGTRYAVQVKTGDKWQVVYQGEDEAKALAVKAASIGDLDESRVRCLRSNGTKPDGKTNWEIHSPEELDESFVIPASTPPKGFYSRIVDYFDNNNQKAGRNVPRWMISGIMLPSFILMGVIVPVAMIAKAGGGNADRSNAPTPGPEQQQTIAVEPTQSRMPPQEQSFIQIVSSAKIQFQSANNDIQRRLARENRLEAVKQLIGTNLQMNDWVGTLYKLSTDGDGEVQFFRIKISDKLTLTHQEEFDSSHPFYAILAGINEGQAVRISGYFRSDHEDYITELSMSEYGSMTDPNYKFTVTSIQPL